MDASAAEAAAGADEEWDLPLRDATSHLPKDWEVGKHEQQFYKSLADIHETKENWKYAVSVVTRSLSRARACGGGGSGGCFPAFGHTSTSSPPHPIIFLPMVMRATAAAH